MVSPEFKKRFPAIFVASVAGLAVATVAGIAFSLKNSTISFEDDDFVWPTASASSPPSSVRTPTEAPTDDVESPAQTPVSTPSTTPSETQSPTLPPEPSPSKTTATPTQRPPRIKVVTSHYDSISRFSGLAYIDTVSPDGEDSFSSEYSINCTKAQETGKVVMKIVSYTNGDLDFQQGATSYPSLTSTLCEGNQVAQGLVNNPGEYADILSPLAGIS
jgi:hypothetical protein